MAGKAKPSRALQERSSEAKTGSNKTTFKAARHLSSGTARLEARGAVARHNVGMMGQGRASDLQRTQTASQASTAQWAAEKA